MRRLELEWEIASEIASEIAPPQPHAPRPASVFGARLRLPAGDSPAVCALLRLLRGVAEAAERGLDLRLPILFPNYHPSNPKQAAERGLDLCLGTLFPSYHPL